MCIGAPRCYFCGKLIAREEDVQKTEYHVGHGQTMLVMICPACTLLKARREGPFATNVGAVAAVVLIIVFVLFMFFAVLRPAFDDAPTRPAFDDPPARPALERNRPVQNR